METPQVNEGESLTMHGNNDSAGVTDQREEDDDGDEDDVSERAGHPSLFCHDGESVACQQPGDGNMRKQGSDWLPQDSS